MNSIRFAFELWITVYSIAGFIISSSFALNCWHQAMSHSFQVLKANGNYLYFYMHCMRWHPALKGQVCFRLHRLHRFQATWKSGFLWSSRHRSSLVWFMYICIPYSPYMHVRFQLIIRFQSEVGNSLLLAPMARCLCFRDWELVNESLGLILQ